MMRTRAQSRAQTRLTSDNLPFFSFLSSAYSSASSAASCRPSSSRRFAAGSRGSCSGSRLAALLGCRACAAGSGAAVPAACFSDF